MGQTNEGKEMLAQVIEKLEESTIEAVNGTVIRQGKWVIPCESCSVGVGRVITPDGRIAQVIVTVTTEEDEWIED